MIYDLIKKFAFIHAPRSAGTNIQLSLLPFLTNGSVVDFLQRKHWPARALKRFVGFNVWSSFYSFGIARPIQEIKRSWYRNLESAREQYLKDKTIFGEYWIKYVEDTWNIKDAEELWKVSNFPETDEAWFKYYFCDENGEQIVTEVINYYELHDRWEEICKKCNIIPAPELRR